MPAKKTSSTGEPSPDAGSHPIRDSLESLRETARELYGGDSSEEIGRIKSGFKYTERSLSGLRDDVSQLEVIVQELKEFRTTVKTIGWCAAGISGVILGVIGWAAANLFSLNAATAANQAVLQRIEKQLEAQSSSVPR